MLRLTVAFALVGFISAAIIPGDFLVSLRQDEIEITNKYGLGFRLLMKRDLEMDTPAIIQILDTQSMLKQEEFLNRQIDMEGRRQSDILYEIFSQFKGPLMYNQYMMLIQTISEFVQKGQINPSILTALEMIMKNEDMTMEDARKMDFLATRKYFDITRRPTLEKNMMNRMMMRNMMRDDMMMMGTMKMPLRAYYTNLMMDPTYRYRLSKQMMGDDMKTQMMLNMMNEDIETPMMMNMEGRRMDMRMMDKEIMDSGDMLRNRMLMRDMELPMTDEKLMMEKRMPLKTYYMDMMMQPMTRRMMMRPWTNNMMMRAMTDNMMMRPLTDNMMMRPMTDNMMMRPMTDNMMMRPMTDNMMMRRMTDNMMMRPMTNDMMMRPCCN